MLAEIKNPRFLMYCFLAAIVAVCEIILFVGLINLLNVHYFYASPIAFCFAVILNYLLQRTFNYKDTESKKRKQFPVFLAISIGGLLINWTITNVAIEILLLMPALAKILGILLTLAYNYTLNTKITFKNAI